MRENPVEILWDDLTEARRKLRWALAGNFLAWLLVLILGIALVW